MGGLLPLATMIKGTEIEDLPAACRYLERQVRKLGVKIRCGTEADAALIEREKPDAVIVATGTRACRPGNTGHRKKSRPQHGDPSQAVEIFHETVRSPAAQAAEPALSAHRQAGDHYRRFDTGMRNRGVSGQAGTEGHRPGDIGQRWARGSRRSAGRGFSGGWRKTASCCCPA